MLNRPDYDRLRDETEFTWQVHASYDVLLELTGVPMKDYYLNPDAGIEAYRKGRPLIAEMFGPDVRLPDLCIPHISYGHANCLGAELRFPEGGEVCYYPAFATLREGVESMKKSVDFASSGMTQYYLDYRAKLTDAFDGETCFFTFGLEGPITTAYILRGHDVFFDPHDEPELFKEFLALVTKSIVEFSYFQNEIHGWPRVNPEAAGMADDVSSMFSPSMWPEFVLPNWDAYYNGRTTGTRHAHVEDLRKEHLHFLEDIGLSSYDPSISPKLTPEIIAENCRVPFFWRLASFHYQWMSCEDVENFVFESVAKGASGVSTEASAPICNEEGVKKLHTFIRAAKEVDRLLKKGVKREELMS